MVSLAEVFAFFAIASDDFAIGFPVIDALYGKVSLGKRCIFAAALRKTEHPYLC